MCHLANEVSIFDENPNSGFKRQTFRSLLQSAYLNGLQMPCKCNLDCALYLAKEKWRLDA